jgi:Fe-S oxidoreductase
MNNSKEKLIVPTMAQYAAEGKRPEILFWVGCIGSFDDRSKKITRAFVRLLNEADIDAGRPGKLLR